MRTAEKASIFNKLSYNHETGEFHWKVDVSRVKEGTKAGTITKTGDNIYVRRIKIDGKSYIAHRLAWLMYYGEWPKGEIYHRDGNHLNNAISNLKPLPHCKIMQGQKLRIDNLSGKSGVCFSPSKGKWVAYISANKKRTYLGTFDTKEMAVFARKAAENTFNFAPEAI